jgi:hypothetical protein
MRRESYSNRFATALEGLDIDNPGTALDRSGHPNPVPRVTGKLRRRHPVEVDDVKFLRANTDRMIKITVPGPFTMSQQAQNDFYKDPEEMALDYAAAVNEEIRDLYAAGADIVQIDEPYMQARPEKAREADDEAGLLFNYSDSPEEHSGSWSMRWLALRYNNPVYNKVALADAQESAMDLLWFQPDSAAPPVPAGAMFQGVANIAVLRGQGGVDIKTWEPWQRRHSDTTYLAIRAGRNTVEDHHGHLDLGSFVLDSMQLRWATDIPPVDRATPPCVADYDLPGYFDVEGQRFTYYRTSTIGHNTLLINGRNQPLECETTIIEFASDPEMAIAVIDLSPAYPDALRVQRGFALINRRDVLIVDEITPRKTLSLTWQMHTRATISLAGATAKLAQGSTPFYATLLSPQAAIFDIGSTAVAPPQAPNTGIGKLVVTLDSVPEVTRLGVYLSPQPDADQALPPLLAQPLWRWRTWARLRR